VGKLTLDTPVQYVKRVGPVRAAQLAELGIHTVEDLLMYFPRRFDLRRQVQPIPSLRGDEENTTVAGEVVDTNYHSYGRRPYFECTLAGANGTVGAKWFHGGYLRDQIKNGLHIAISGKVSTYKETIQFINPRLQILYDPQGSRLDTDELLPVYPAGAKLSSRHIALIAKQVLGETKRLIRGWFDTEYLSQRGLMSRPAAVAGMHRPEDREQWSAARRRMAYDECFLMQLGIALVRMQEVSRPAYPLKCTPEIDGRIRMRFPFKLTAAQDKVITEITADLARQRPMNRLLQGDVGSGKTVVALYAALLTVARSKQVCIMAPTEILASQHYRKIAGYLKDSRVRTGLLTGGQRPVERTRTLDSLKSGDIDIIVGTHALLSEDVNFANLALVVVDEQHKFGVRQRSGIRGKGFAPHYLVMTATPIPRTLAMTVFGDLDVSIIDELPPHRGHTTTRCVSEQETDEVWSFVRERLSGGLQAYLIYPLVSPSPQLELTAAEEAHRQLTDGPLKGFELSLIHGQMPSAEKQRVMGGFRSKRIHALVASVVVEVGLDVPDANVMVVMHAERFGLAQLHQLRGRIGRSSADATCILVASPGNPAARRRLEVLVETSDGFKIAEEDLRLRGPGEFFGTRQHGLPELKVANLIEDFELLRLARRDAFAIVNEDPALSAPHHQQLRREVLRIYEDKFNLIIGA
jgi:ATP-dependent DNA helicase RecG